MAFVRSMLAACERLGHGPCPALAAAQIAPAQVADTHARITAAQMERLSDQLMRELDDEALGWFTRRLPWGSYGMLARASISAPTLGVALKRWCRHHGLLAGDVQLALATTADAGTATVTLTEPAPAPWLVGELREFCHVSLLRNLLGLSSWLVDSRLPLLAVDLAYPAPAHADAYAVLFAGPCRFDQPHTRLHLDASCLALPLRRDEAALRHMLQRALPLTVHAYRKDRLLVRRVRQALATHPEASHSAEALAALLHTSARSLHRQLKDEGASLQALKDTVRRDRAQALLLRTQRPLKQVAQAVGFENEKSFIRAFKGWTGRTPADYRSGGGTTSTPAT
jgi:AraC-like DNA-binding protein